MLIKTLLNKVERFKSFIYGDSRLTTVNGSDSLIIDIKPRRNSKPECPECGKRCKTYDTQPARLFEYMPIWVFKVFFRYAPVGLPALTMESELRRCPGDLVKSK